MKRVIIILFFLAITFYASAQCAMCRAVAQSGTNNGQSVGGGLNHAILYLMAAPYLLLFIFFRKKIWGLLKELRGMWG